MPIFYLLLQSIFFPEEGKAGLLPFVRGIVFSIPAMLLFLLLQGLVPPIYTGSGIYLRYTFSDLLLYPLLAIGMFFLAWRTGRSGSIDSIYGAVSFFAGAFSLLGLFDIVTNEHYRNLYLLVLLPMLRFPLVLLVPFLLLQILEEGGFARVLYILLLLAVPAVLGLAPFFYYSNRLFLSVASTVLLVAGAGAFFWFFRRRV